MTPQAWRSTAAARDLRIVKRAGRIDNLRHCRDRGEPAGHDGHLAHALGHPRPGHGRENAHPHPDQSGKLVLVHNGVIENYQTLRDQFIAKGHTFQSQTDTEVLSHLVGTYFDESKEKDGTLRLVNAVKVSARTREGHLRHRRDAWRPARCDRRRTAWQSA
jgi:glucosamine--fructose-6-phosphate aminotransferase (isomerizing)